MNKVFWGIFGIFFSATLCLADPVASDPFLIPDREPDTTITANSLHLKKGMVTLSGNVKAVKGTDILTCQLAYLKNDPIWVLATQTPRLYRKESVPEKKAIRETTLDALTILYFDFGSKTSASGTSNQETGSGTHGMKQSASGSPAIAIASAGAEIPVGTPKPASLTSDPAPRRPPGKTDEPSKTGIPASAPGMFSVATQNMDPWAGYIPSGAMILKNEEPVKNVPAALASAQIQLKKTLQGYGFRPAASDVSPLATAARTIASRTEELKALAKMVNLKPLIQNLPSETLSLDPDELASAGNLLENKLQGFGYRPPAASIPRPPASETQATASGTKKLASGTNDTVFSFPSLNQLAGVVASDPVIGELSQAAQVNFGARPEFEASGSVNVKIEERTWDLATYSWMIITSDTMQGFKETKKMKFFGNVRVKDKTHFGQGRFLDYDKALSMVTLYGDARIETEKWSEKEKKMVMQVVTGQKITYDLKTKLATSE